MKCGELHGVRLCVADSAWRKTAEMRAAVLDLLAEDIDDATREKLRTLIHNTIGSWTLVRFLDSFGSGADSTSRARYGNLSATGRALHPRYSDVIDLPTKGIGRDRNAVVTSFTHHEIAHAVIARLLSDKSEKDHAIAVEDTRPHKAGETDALLTPATANLIGNSKKR